MSDSQPRFRSLELAACGWSPADWQRIFYPEDLPEDWRVSYYANEFACVLLPATVWENPSIQAAFWQAEVQPDFRFYLEITPQLLQGEHWQKVRGAVEKYLSPRVEGVLLTADAAEALPPDWQTNFPVHVQQSNDWLAVMPVNGKVQTGVLRANQPLAPQALRQIFEHLQIQAGHPDVILFLDVPWGTVEHLRLMQQLYGV